jgi:signal transduction histidine kinase
VADERHSADGSRPSLTLAALPVQTDPVIKALFYRATQEALANIDEHAHASRVRLALASDGAEGSNSPCGTTAPGSIPPHWRPPRH